MLQGFLAEFQFPVAGALDALAPVFLVFLPVVEVTDEVDVGGVGCPLAEHPALGELVESEVEVAAGKLRQCLLAVSGQLAYLPQGVVVTASNSLLEGFQPSVVANQTDMVFFLKFEV